MLEHWKTSYLWRNNASNVLSMFWTLEAGKSENIWNGTHVHSKKKSHLKQMKAKELCCSRLLLLVPVVHIFNGNNLLV